MMYTKIYKTILVFILVGLVVPLALIQTPVSARPPMDATPVSSEFKDPKTLNLKGCATDPKNLITNGSMAPSHDTQYGSLANAWEPFVFDGKPPQFRWVGNEQIDPNGSQQIFSTGTFDAGIYQTVSNLQPGVYYWFRLGYSLAAKSYSGPNVRVDSIGRKVGFDPFGGTDPKSPNVIWGPDFFNGEAATNIIQMILVFPARSDRATLFIRAMARDGSSGENRVWLDAVCMEARNDMPTATPLPPTATPLPLSTPTDTPRPAVVRAPASPTKIALVPTNTPIPASISQGNTPTPANSPVPSSTARYARPDATPESSPPIDLGLGVAAGTGIVFVFGALLFFVLGILWWKRMN
jgi:hypothetical protein